MAYLFVCFLDGNGKIISAFPRQIDNLIFKGENNMDYKFELLSTGSLVIRLPKEFDILEAFLNVEVSEFGDWIAETVDKVLNEKSDYEKISANIFGADVRRDKTVIFNKYDEDEIEIPLEIETITLRNLIDIWLNEYTKLKTEKNNN